jgi:hypothetical protein
MEKNYNAIITAQILNIIKMEQDNGYTIEYVSEPEDKYKKISPTNMYLISLKRKEQTIPMLCYIRISKEEVSKNNINMNDIFDEINKFIREGYKSE